MGVSTSFLEKVIPKWTEFGFIVADMRDGVERYLPDSATEVKTVLESSAVAQLALTTLGSLPYVFAASKLRINDPYHFISVRASYFETALICAASAVHNMVMTMIYLGLVVLTLGIFQQINYGLQKHWAHTFYSLAGVGIGLMGTLVPILGVGSAWTTFTYFWNRVTSYFKNDLEHFEDPLIFSIKNIYKKNHAQFLKAVETFVEDQQRIALIHPFLDEFNKGLPAVKTLDQLIGLVKKTWNDCSTIKHVSPESK